MHNPYEENYHRGYEWWLMNQAKARNPDIKLYGLSWAFPQWVTCDPGTLNNCSTSTNNPYAHVDQLATYITKWVAGAKNTYGLDIDYIGSWNERAYSIPCELLLPFQPTCTVPLTLATHPPNLTCFVPMSLPPTL